MARHASQTLPTGFFQEQEDNDLVTVYSDYNPSSDSEYNPNYVVPTDHSAYKAEACALCQGLFEYEKNFYYKATQLFYANPEGFSVKGKAAFWKSLLKGKYSTATRYMGAIRKWQRSDVEYPPSVPIVYLLWSQSLLRSDKADFVEFLKRRRTTKEIQDWITLRNNGGKEPEYYGWKYLQKYLPDDVLEVIVDRAKRYGVKSLLDWNEPALTPDFQEEEY